MTTTTALRENDTDKLVNRYMTRAGLLVEIQPADGTTYTRLLEGNAIVEYLLSGQENLIGFDVTDVIDPDTKHEAWTLGRDFLINASKTFGYRDIYLMAIRLLGHFGAHDWYLEEFGLSALPKVADMKKDGEWDYMIGREHMQFFTAEGMRKGLSGRELERYAVKRLTTMDAQELLEDAVAKVAWDFENWQRRYEPSDSVEA